MRRFVSLPTLLATLLAGLACTSRPTAENVVLVVVDTLRADHLSIYGYSRDTTPLLEVWAAGGLVFDQALAASPWTLPTFGSILTGLTPPRHAAGRRIANGRRGWRRAPLAEGVPTLAEQLLAAGFRTGAIVNNPFLRPRFGAEKGFEHYDYAKGRKADVSVDRALAWLGGEDDRRFFLMLHLIDPHLPYAPPASTRGRFAVEAAPDFVPRGRKNLVSMLEDMGDLDRELIVARYDEEIAFIDQELDRFFRSLEEAGLWESTLVVLTSDHGEELFDHGGFEHGHTMFQEVLRVPLVVWGRGVVTGRESEPVSVIDLMPTILEATGSDSDAVVEGASLWPTLVGRSAPLRREILAENTLWGREKKSLVAWPYKLILEPGSGRTELYHLEADPRESRDLATERATLARALEQRLLASIPGDDETGSETEIELSEEMEQELRALGYLD